MLGDQLNMSVANWQSRIKNRNIPVDNLNKFGNEKGLLVWYQKVVSSSANDIRNKYIMYPLNIPYRQLEIEKWIVDTNSAQFIDGFQFKEIKYWRLDVYAEKTVVYDRTVFEGNYVPRLCEIWDIICQCRDLQKAGKTDIAAYLEDMENQKDNPFYNENKRKKKIKPATSGTSGTSGTGSTVATNVISFGDSNDIELDF
jgi:hypothetical protein